MRILSSFLFLNAFWNVITRLCVCDIIIFFIINIVFTKIIVYFQGFIASSSLIQIRHPFVMSSKVIFVISFEEYGLCIVKGVGREQYLWSEEYNEISFLQWMFLCNDFFEIKKEKRNYRNCVRTDLSYLIVLDTFYHWIKKSIKSKQWNFFLNINEVRICCVPKCMHLNINVKTWYAYFQVA